MNPESRPRLIPVTAWEQHHPWPPLGGLRHLIFHAAKNGFDRVIRRVGSRILIDEAAFFDWVASGEASALPNRRSERQSNVTPRKQSADAPEQRGAK